MTNRYPGKCTKCGQTVAPQAGTCEKVGGKWVVSHTECPIAPKAAAQSETVAATVREYIPAGCSSDLHRAGDAILHEGQIVVITSARHNVDEEGATGTYTVRPATAEEAAPLAQQVREREIEDARNALISEFMERGEDGEGDGGPDYSDRWHERGSGRKRGGQCFRVGTEYVSLLCNMGSWTRSRRLPATPEIVARIKALGA